MIDCLRSFCLVESRGLAHLAALGLVSMMLRCVIVKTVKSVGITGIHKQAALERQDLSCMYLARHELDNVNIIIVIVIIIIIMSELISPALLLQY